MSLVTLSLRIHLIILDLQSSSQQALLTFNHPTATSNHQNEIKQPLKAHQLLLDSSKQAFQQRHQSSLSSTSWLGDSHQNNQRSAASPASPASASPLNDLSLDWDDSISRPWLLLSNTNNDNDTDTTTKRPPAMIVLTEFGWNHPNQTFNENVFRNIRSRELVQGVVNHPWFHPRAWHELNSGILRIDPNVRYYVFLDKHSCGEKNYPHYGKGQEQGISQNRDHTKGSCCLDHKNHYAQQVLHSRLFQEARDRAVFVIFDCSGSGPILKAEFKRTRKNFVRAPRQLAFVSLSAPESHLIQHQDLGLAPPALWTCNDLDMKMMVLEDCDEDHNIENNSQQLPQQRPILLSFAGKISRSKVRMDLEQLSNDQDVLIGGWEKPMQWLHVEQQEGDETSADAKARAYLRLAVNSSFGAAPRGDNLFSYRFAELMSCGTIPVVYADDWKFPFGDALVDWDSLLVRIPERDANQTLDILRKHSARDICQRRRGILQFYDRYMKDGTAVIRGIIDTFELQAQQPTLPTRSLQDMLENFKRRNSSNFPVEIDDSIPGVPEMGDW